MFQTEAQIEAGETPMLMMPARTYWRQYREDGTVWYDFCQTLPLGTNVWYIAVSPEGFILSAEQDPTMLTVARVEYWQIEHPGPQEAIITHRWNGTEVE